jgi:hypothetical protein
VRLAILTPREASIFACVCDTIVAPEPVLPPVRETDAVQFFDRWLERSPRANRIGLRVLLYAAELVPRLLGLPARLRALPERERANALQMLQAARATPVRQLVKLMQGVATLAYYGDDAVMRRLGYDAQANLDRGRRLRAEEGRP